MINLAFGFGTIAGAAVTIMIAASTMTPGGTLGAAQAQYRKCISLQAPADVCLKAYLLPKETRQ